MTRFLPFSALLLLASCAGQPGTWGWYVVDPTTANGWVNIKFLLRGFSSTIQVSLLAAFASIVIGLLITMPGLSANKWVRLPNRIYVEFIRAIPLLPMLFWVFYGLPVVMKSMGFQINIDPFWGAVITLAISDSAFTAEIFRSGIQAVPRGQTEASSVIGLSRAQDDALCDLAASDPPHPAAARQSVHLYRENVGLCLCHWHAGIDPPRQ